MTLSLRDDVRERLLLVTGKGGVGKTTVAAALARGLAQTGKRVLAAEISYESPREAGEPDGSATSPLAAALGTPPLSDEPRRLEGTLHAARLSPLAGHLQFLRDTLPVRLLADAAMKSAAVRRFFVAAPTLAELGILVRLLHLLPQYERVVCDLPATGHALALAQVPQALVDVLRSGPIHSVASEGLRVLRDPATTTSVLVTLPEPLPVSEGIELHEGLRRLAIRCGLVIMNRVPRNPFTPEERAAVERMVVDRTRTLGARRLPRVDRAVAAKARLERELGMPAHVVYESPSDAVTNVLRQLGSES